MEARPVAPPAPYLGGKHRLAARIIERLSLVPHQCYVEPFVGMGGVFLRRPFRAQAEVVNDISRDVATLFRVLQRHYVPLMDMLRWQVTSRAEFERLVAAVPDTLTDLERAARFLYLQRTTFGGKIAGRSFGTSATAPARFDVTKLGAILEDVHERLAGVFDRADFERLAEILAGIKGRFLLSLNDTPEVRRIFGAFELDAVELNYSVNGKQQVQAAELLIGPKDAGGGLFG